MKRTGIAIALATMIAAAGATPAAAVDDEPPVITGFVASPQTLPAEGGTVAVSVEVLDDEAVTAVDAVAYDPGGGSASSALEPGDGDAWAGSLGIGANWTNDPVGWTVEIFVTGEGGNTTSEIVGSIDVEGQPQFDQNPIVSGGSATPSAVGSDGGQVTISAWASDDRSVMSVSVAIVDPGHSGVRHDVDLNPVGNGEWSVPWTAPANYEADAVSYELTATATDDIGLQGSNSIGSLVVAGVGGGDPDPDPPGDLPPTIQSASVSPATLDHTGGTATITAVVYDDIGLSSVTAEVYLGVDHSTVQLYSAGGTETYTADVDIAPNPTTESRTWGFTVEAVDTGYMRTTADAGTVVVAAAPPVEPEPEPDPVAMLSVTPPPHFGTVRPGVRSARFLTLTNDGTSAVAGTLRSQAGAFRFTRGRGAAAFSLAPGQSRRFRVVFRAMTPRRYAGRIAVVRDDGRQRGLSAPARGRVVRR